MGACVSSTAVARKPLKTIKVRRKCRGKKYHLTTVTNGNRKRISDAGARASDLSVSEFVQTTTTCRRSEVSNSTFHLTQLQWHHSQIDANGIYCYLLKVWALSRHKANGKSSLGTTNLDISVECYLLGTMFMDILFFMEKRSRLFRFLLNAWILLAYCKSMLDKGNLRLH